MPSRQVGFWNKKDTIQEDKRRNRQEKLLNTKEYSILKLKVMMKLAAVVNNEIMALRNIRGEYDIRSITEIYKTKYPSCNLVIIRDEKWKVGMRFVAFRSEDKNIVKTDYKKALDWLGNQKVESVERMMEQEFKIKPTKLIPNPTQEQVIILFDKYSYRPKV